MIDRLKSWAKRLKQETYALYFAYQDPRLPWYVKALVIFVVAHTFSPIDLIPDFIPVLGYLDDLIITPLGLALALKLIPPVVMAEARARAELDLFEGKTISRWGTLIVVSIWLMAVVLGIVIAFRYFRTK
jgi:uncharacterized membrane protein YkvA (DUF1232 family)